MTAGGVPRGGGGVADEELLREILTARAEAVRTSPDAFGAIQARVGRASRRRRGLAVGLGALVTAAATVVAMILNVGSGVPVPPAFPTAMPTAFPTAVPTGPAVSPTAPATPTPTTPVPELAALPVYLVGTVDGRDVLFREYHDLAYHDLADDALARGELAARIHSALTDMIAGRSADPDYRTEWPAAAQVHGVSVADAAIMVDLAVPLAAPAQPVLALQQLVHTATAVAAISGEQLPSVRVLVDGERVAQLWGVAVSEPLTRFSSAEILAPIWLSSPQHGASVGRTIDVHVVGTVFEATAVVRVRDGHGGVVREDTVTLDNGAPSRGEVRVSLTLTPGTYTLEVFSYSPRDGSVQGLDDHTITVR